MNESPTIFLKINNYRIHHIIIFGLNLHLVVVKIK